MADEQNEREERQPVVQEDRARELEAVVALAEPEERSGDGEENGEVPRNESIHSFAVFSAWLWTRNALVLLKNVSRPKEEELLRIHQSFPNSRSSICRATGREGCASTNLWSNARAASGSVRARSEA